MDRRKASDFDQRALDLYDDFAHGRISRRDFAQRLAVITVGGVTAEQLIESLSPNYAWAQQVAPNDPRIQADTIEYDSPKGGKKIKGLLARPAKEGKFPAVLVIHENRGLNPYIADVARRLATSGFLALAPDALSPLGGYPGNDDEGRTMQAKRNQDEMLEDFIAGAELLKSHAMSTGKVGAVGFCYGGGVVNQLVVRIPGTVIAGAPFYGRQPSSDDVPKIKASLLIQYAELDTRINEGWPAYEAALKKAGVKYEAFTYPKTNHGFHNDSTPRYDEAAAKLAWQRTIDFFKQTLG
ncbi:MAG: dienelactone hydrolase family protein [Pirellula sp.]